MYASFPWGAGLKNGQPILLAGVNIGFVRKVELVPDGTLAITMAIQKEYKIPQGTTASVQANGIFGDQLIALTPVVASTQYMASGDTIPSGKGSPGIADVLAKADSITREVETIASSIRTEFVDGGGIAELRATTANLAALMNQLGKVIGQQSNELTLTQQKVRSTLAAVDSAVVDSTMRAFRTTSSNLATLTGDLEATKNQLDAILYKVDSGPGSIAKLMNDPSIHNRVDSLLTNLDALLADIKANPRRYINLRVF